MESAKGIDFYPSSPYSNVNPKDLSLDFDNLFKEIVKERPNVAAYLKNLDSQSTVTFNHSVNVALITYYKLSQEKEYTYEDIKNYVSAALVHDAGKLTTPLEVLHSKIDYRAQGTEEGKRKADEEYDIMMRHSIDGLEVGIDYNFSKEEIAAIISHHVGDVALEKGTEGNFEGATDSRKPWKSIYGENTIEKLLSRELFWITPKDVKALEIISFCDIIEATRSIERAYRAKDKPWGEKVADDFNDKPNTVCEIVHMDIKSNQMNPIFLNDVLNEQFRRHIDIFEKENKGQDARIILNEFTKDLPYNLSKDKLDEIKKDPRLGELFFQKIEKDGEYKFVIRVFNEKTNLEENLELDSIIRPDYTKGYNINVSNSYNEQNVDGIDIDIIDDR